MVRSGISTGRRIALFLLVALIIQVLATYSIERFVVYPEFEALEQRLAIDAYARSAQALSREIERVDLGTHDWAHWDEIVDYLDGKDPAFADYLSEAGSESTAADWLLLFQKDGLLHDQMIGRNGKNLAGALTVLAQPDGPLQTIFVQPALKTNDRIDFRVAGFVHVQGKVLAVSARPILKSDTSGEIKGVLLLGQVLAPSLLSRMQAETVTGFRLLENDVLWRDVPEQKLQRPGLDHPIRFRFEQEGITLQGQQSVLVGTPFLLEVQHDTSMTRSAQLMQRTALIVYSLITVVMAFGIYFLLLEPTLLKPLRQMQRIIGRIRKDGRMEQRLPLPKSPELSAVAQGFNAMMDRLAEHQDLITEQSLTDALTGVPNRRAFDAQFERDWKHAVNAHYPLTLVILDIDNFKPFNDLYGHQAGDVCLRQIAQTLQQTLRRKKDFLARYGGEEFVILMPHTNVDAANRAVNSLLVSIRALAIPHEGSDHKIVTLSIGGIAGVPGPASTPQDWLHVADTELYSCKDSGRNQGRVLAYLQK